MTNDIKALIDYYEREKGLSREKILIALESAFLSAYRKMVPGANHINSLRAEINVDKGKVRIVADLEVVEDEAYTDKFNQIPMSLALKLNPTAVAGDIHATNVTPKGFGRIAVQTARQTIQQKIIDAEKEMLYEAFKDRAGELITGVIRRFEKGDIIVDLDKFEARMPFRERANREEYSVGDRLRFYVVEVRNDARGPEVILSRSHPNLVRRLFELEVTEIRDKKVEIRGIARESGFRTKMSVVSNEANIDPVGACVGMRGSRVREIVRELNNERVDILEWTGNPADFVAQSIAPVEAMDIIVDEDAKKVMVIIDGERELSRAKGSKGQNARLTARLLGPGWDVQIVPFDTKAEEARRKQEAAEEVRRHCQAAAKELSGQLEISEDMAMNIVNMGGTNSQAVAEFEAAHIAENLGISYDDAMGILEKARSISNL